MLNPSMLTDSDREALEAILAKSPVEVTEDEAAVLRARRDYLSEDQKSVFTDALKVEAKADKPVKADK